MNVLAQIESNCMQNESNVFFFPIRFDSIQFEKDFEIKKSKTMTVKSKN